MKARTGIITGITTIFVAMILSIVVGQTTQAANLPGPVSTSKASWTPRVDVGTFQDGTDREVWHLEPYAGRMYACGKFSTVYEASGLGGRAFTRHSMFSFYGGGANKGRITSFAPTIRNGSDRGVVRDCVPGYAANTMLIVGEFTSVNGKAVRNIALINTTNGDVVPTFSASANATISDVVKARDRYFLFGKFSQINDRGRKAIATINKNGSFSSYFRSGFVGTIGPESGPLQAYRGVVRPGGKELVAIVNVNTIDGKTRRHIAKWTLGTTRATLQDWYPNVARTSTCQKYMVIRDVQYDPAGRYFYTVSTGGPNRGFCDRVIKFDTTKRGTRVAAQWILGTCGDTSHSAAVTSGQIYVQGHMKCVRSNPNPTSPLLDRYGIFLTRPNGYVYKTWRSDQPRCVGGKALTVTTSAMNTQTAGLWSGIDCAPGIIFRPYNG